VRTLCALLQEDSNALALRVSSREGQTKKKFLVRGAIDGIGGAKFAGHGFGGVAECREVLSVHGSNTQCGFDTSNEEVLCMVRGATIFHGEAIPGNGDVRHGLLKEDRAGCRAESILPLEFFENLL